MATKKEKLVPQIPTDVFEEVFHRLPLKSMCRFKVISKEWNSIISNPKFISEDSCRRAMSSTHMIVYHKYCDDVECDLNSEVKTHMILRQKNGWDYYDTDCVLEPEIYALDFSGGSTLPAIKSCSKDNASLFDYRVSKTILGSYNGLVAIACCGEYVLWNPLTRKSKFVRRFSSSEDKLAQVILSGLRYYDSSHEYSVIATVNTATPPKSPMTTFDGAMPCEKTISCLTDLSSTGVHEQMLSGAPILGLGTPHKMLIEGGIGKVICGFPHWLLSFHDSNNSQKLELQRKIIYFDFKDKVYKQWERPGKETTTVVGLAALGGETQLGIMLHDPSSPWLEVWVMKEYGNVESWSNLFVISKLLFNGIPNFDYMEMLGFLPTGEILIDVNLEEFWAYDDATGNARQVQLGHSTSREDYIALTCYYPSVVSPHDFRSIDSITRKRWRTW